MRKYSFVFSYINDLLVASDSLEGHLIHPRLVFKNLRDNGLRVNMDKCVLGQPRVEFVSYEVSSEGLEPYSPESKPSLTTKTQRQGPSFTNFWE